MRFCKRSDEKIRGPLKRVCMCVSGEGTMRQEVKPHKIENILLGILLKELISLVPELLEFILHNGSHEKISNK